MKTAISPIMIATKDTPSTAYSKVWSVCLKGLFLLISALRIFCPSGGTGNEFKAVSDDAAVAVET